MTRNGSHLLLNEQGSVAAELTLLTPALLLLLFFVVFCGRFATSHMEVSDAAHQAARAATLARNSTQATMDARSAAEAALNQAGITCRDLAITTRAGTLAPGSTVTVELTCRIGLSDLSFLGFPGTASATATASSVVDEWRGTNLTAGSP